MRTFGVPGQVAQLDGDLAGEVVVDLPAGVAGQPPPLQLALNESPERLVDHLRNIVLSVSSWARRNRSGDTVAETFLLVTLMILLMILLGIAAMAREPELGWPGTLGA